MKNNGLPNVLHSSRSGVNSLLSLLQPFEERKMNLSLLLPIAKQLALRAITHKLVDEPEDAILIRSLNGEPAPVEFCKNKTMRMSAIYTVFISSILTYLSANGTIDPDLYNLLSNLAPMIIEMLPNYSETN